MNFKKTLFILKIDLNYVIVDESSAGNNVPLTVDELDKLRSLWTYLIDDIHYPSIANSLFENGVISKKHKQSIESKPEEFKRVEILLDILQRRSRENFHQFLLCLELCQYEHIAEAFGESTGSTEIIITYVDLYMQFLTKSSLINIYVNRIYLDRLLF